MTDQSNTQVESKNASAAAAQPRRIDFSISPRKLGKVLDEIMPQGEKVKVRDFVDQEIVIRFAKPFSGRFGDALYIVFTDDGGGIYNTVIGNKVLVEKISTVVDALPVSLTVVEKQGSMGKYYDIAEE